MERTGNNGEELPHEVTSVRHGWVSYMILGFKSKNKNTKKNLGERSVFFFCPSFFFFSFFLLVTPVTDDDILMPSAGGHEPAEFRFFFLLHHAPRNQLRALRDRCFQVLRGASTYDVAFFILFLLAVHLKGSPRGDSPARNPCGRVVSLLCW